MLFKGQPNCLLGFGLASGVMAMLGLWDVASVWAGGQAMTPAGLALGRPLARYGVLLVRAGPGRWWAPLVLASEWTAGQLRPGPEFVRRPRRLGPDLAATLLEWECPHQALQGAPASQQGD